MRSSWASGCSIIVGVYASMRLNTRTSSSVYAEFASSMKGSSGYAFLTASATFASHPGLIFSFTRW